MFADHRRKLEAVEVRHADVDQNHGDLGSQQMLERLAPGCRLQEIFAETAQNSFVSEKLPGLVVDQENVDLVLFEPWPLSVQPHTQRRQELLGIDRLRKII